MNAFKKTDLVGRKKIKKEFGDKYIFEDTGDYDSTDLMATGITTGNIYNIELKVRNYSIEYLSGATYCEVPKITAFNESYKKEPERKLIYFNYCCNDSWIAFDMTNRIKHNINLDDFIQKDLKKTTCGNSDIIDKKILVLHFIQDIYIKDQMMVKPTPSIKDRIKALKKLKQ
jgi:hypothetical protein